MNECTIVCCPSCGSTDIVTTTTGDWRLDTYVVTNTCACGHIEVIK